MEGQLLLTAPLLTTLTIETIKWAYRKYMAHDPEMDFAPIFYDLCLPFFTAVWSILLGMIGWAEPIVFSWEALLQWALAIIITLVLYNVGVKPMKEYRKTHK